MGLKVLFQFFFRPILFIVIRLTNGTKLTFKIILLWNHYQK